MEWPGVEPATFCVAIQHPSHYTTRPLHQSAGIKGVTSLVHWLASVLWVSSVLWNPVQAPGCNAPLIRFFILALYILFACLYRMLPHLSFFSSLFPYLVLWRCWLGGRKGIRPVNNWVVGCWRGYLSGVRCRLAHGPAEATATHCLLLQ